MEIERVMFSWISILDVFKSNPTWIWLACPDQDWLAEIGRAGNFEHEVSPSPVLRFGSYFAVR